MEIYTRRKCDCYAPAGVNAAFRNLDPTDPAYWADPDCPDCHGTGYVEEWREAAEVLAAAAQ